MKIQAILIVIMLVLISTIILPPSIKADDPVIDEEQTSHPYEVNLGTPGLITIVDQGFKPDRTQISKIEIYVDSFGGGTLTAGIGYETATLPYWVWLGNEQKTSMNTGWVTFDFNDASVTPGNQYHIKISYQGSSHVKIGWDNDNPYKKGHMRDNSIGDRIDDDLAFKVWGYDNNDLPNPPTLDSPNNGASFIIDQGQTKDVTLKATTIDPDGDQIQYRFWDDTTEDVIGTTGWMQSGQQGSITWDNLPIGTYDWYVKAKDNEGFGGKSPTYTFTITENTDNEPPDPDPSEWDTAPYATGTNSITMKAETAYDPSGGVEYLFKEITENPGGSSSDWQSSRSYTDNGLNPDTQYKYKIKTKDLFGNEGEWSDIKSAVTDDDGPENNPPEAPIKPIGNQIVFIINPYTYLISAEDPDGDQIKFGLDWNGDDIVDEWSDYGNSGYLRSIIHIWFFLGLNKVKVKAKDTHGLESPWSEEFPVAVVEPDEENSAPFKPSTPVGQTSCEAGELYQFSTLSYDLDDDQLTYAWDMNGDFEADYLTPAYDVDETCYIDYSWSKTGNYQIRVYSFDEDSEISEWSDSLTVTVLKNNNDLPIKPTKPGLGPSEGYVNDEYQYSSWSYDPEDEKIKYGWDWNGDNTVDEWSNWIDNNKYDDRSHMWTNPGTYYIKVKVKDESGFESPWSEKRKIVISSERIGTVFTPGNGDFSEPKVDGDVWIMRDDKDTFETLTPDPDAGSLGVYASASAGYPLFDSIVGHSWVESCHRLDFYVGEKKLLKFDAEILVSSSQFANLAGWVANNKVWHIDDWDNKEARDLLMNSDSGSDYIFQRILELTAIYIIKFLAKANHNAGVLYLINSYILPKLMMSAEGMFFFGKFLMMRIPSKIVMALIYFGEFAVFSMENMNYKELNTNMMNFEKEGIGEIIHIQFEQEFDPGDHKIWVGLESSCGAAGVGGSCAYQLGQVSSIKVEGLASPDIPILNIPNQAYMGEILDVEFSCNDPNDDQIKFKIDWGDGITTTTDFYNSEEEGMEEHQYTNPGIYTISITAEDCDRMKSKVNTYTIAVLEDETSPNVEITQPIRGIYFYDDQKFTSFPTTPLILGDITIQADAYDQEGVKKVIFKKDSITFETDTTEDYTGNCNLPSNGLKLVDFKAIAEDYAGNQDIDTQEALYWNKGQQTMTATQTDGSTPDSQKTYNIKIPKPQGSTVVELEQGVDDLRSKLQNDYSGATITYSYKIDYGDETPSETIEKKYPLLELNREYQEKGEYTISVTLTTTLNIDGQTYSHEEDYEITVGEGSGVKSSSPRFLQLFYQRFPLLAKIFEMINQFKEKIS